MRYLFVTLFAGWVPEVTGVQQLEVKLSSMKLLTTLMNKRYGQDGNEKKKAFQYTMVTVNDLIDSPYQIIAPCLMSLSNYAMLRCYQEIAKKSKIIQFTGVVASLTRVCVLLLVQCQVEREDRLTMTTQ